MIPDNLMLKICGALLFATFLILVVKAPGATSKWRPWVSLFASGLAGFSLALSVLVVLAPHWLPNVASQWLLTGYAGCVLFLVARCRGNVAKLLPPFKRIEH